MLSDLTLAPTGRGRWPFGPPRSLDSAELSRAKDSATCAVERSLFSARSARFKRFLLFSPLRQRRNACARGDQPGNLGTPRFTAVRINLSLRGAHKSSPGGARRNHLALQSSCGMICLALFVAGTFSQRDPPLYSPDQVARR